MLFCFIRIIKLIKEYLSKANGNVAKITFENQPVKRFVKYFPFFLRHVGTEFENYTI
jgi:hypothetical protein